MRTNKRKLSPKPKGQTKSPGQSVRLWTVAIDHKGCNELAESFPTRGQARKAIVDHLKEYHAYDGPETFEAAMSWVAERDDRFDVQIYQHTFRPPPPPPPEMLRKSEHPALERLVRFIMTRGFVTLTYNPSNNANCRFEAWAYEGPLDFHKSNPVRFGMGSSPLDVLAALDDQLSRKVK